MYSPTGKFIRFINFENEKNIEGILSFTIHKQKNILILLLEFKENETLTSSIYIYDLNEFKIIRIYKLKKYIPGNFMTYDDKNDFILISGNNHCIHLLLISPINEEEPLIHTFSEEGKEDGKLNEPHGIIIQDNIIWIVDSENNRIQLFSYFNQIEHLT